VTGDEGRAVGFAAFERGGEIVEAEAAFDLGALVTAVAARLEDGLHVAIEIHGALFRGRIFGGYFGDAVGDEVIDGVGGGKAGTQRRDSHLGRRGEPRVGGGAARSPKRRGLGTLRGARAGVDGGVVNTPLRLVGGPPGVGVRNGARARRQQPPRRAAGGRIGDDGFAEFRAEGTFAFRFDAAEDGFEHHRGGAPVNSNSHHSSRMPGAANRKSGPRFR
jgi:hypothetical protein